MERVLVPEYSGGRDFVDRLKQVTGENSYGKLANFLDIPSSTIATWVERGLVPYEIILRVHLSLGVSIKWLALGVGDPYQGVGLSKSITFQIYLIKNGQLEESGSLSLDQKTLKRYGLRDDALVVEHSNVIFFIDQSETNPSSGHYLLDIDGNVSIKKVIRIPGKKLSIEFDDTLLEISEDDVSVRGRVLMSMNRE